MTAACCRRGRPSSRCGVTGKPGVVCSLEAAVQRFLLAAFMTVYFFRMHCFPTNSELLFVKPSQAKLLTVAETFTKRKSTPPYLLAIPAFERNAGLSNRFLNSNRLIC